MSIEVQGHGFTFETWVRETFFAGYQSDSYTSEWDVNKQSNINYGGVPVSIKTAKYGNSIGLGDALRQFRISEDFLLITGFRRQEDGNKRFVNIVAAHITVATWQSLWNPITEADLLKLDSTIKNRELTYEEARVSAQQIKSQPPFTKAQMTVNPKIDSKTQRRLQCTLGFSTLFSVIALEAEQLVVDTPKLFGVESMGPISSNPRVFNRNLQPLD